MLPCKKRKLVEQPIPQSKVKRKEELKLDTAVPNLERSIIPQQVPTTQDENQESTGGLQTCENRESSDLKLYSQMTSKLTAESSLRSGKGFTRISALDASERNQHAEELEPSTWCLGVRNSGEGKPPKNLQLKGESPVKRKTHVFTSQTPKLSSQAKKSLQLEGNASGNLQESKSSDSSPPDDEERDDTALFIPVEEQASPVGEKKHKKKKATCKQKRERRCEEESSFSGDLKLDDMLNRTLEDGAKQHKLTAINVRNILHEVITNEHVVAMMKAAINETEDMPMFEPKMTRSKLKEVVEKGVVIPTWNISPIKKANEIKAPQFVDIPLEEEDSSDEEYQPEEEEEDETAEESLLESDVESTSSSPRGPKGYRATACELMETDEEAATSPETKVSAPPFRHVSAEVVPMGPPPPPPKLRQSKDSMFMEKLHAVDEELASSPVCMDSFQPLDDSLIAFRTRSKRPLKDIPLGQLEAELCAPDITPDMYDPSTTDDEDWKKWLQGLMTDDAGNEDEADDDDDDDPEYNFLEDLDEPDTEDFRNDRAVRITKKEVNELMEELFETFQDEMGFSHVDDDGQEDEDSSPESHSTFNTPQAIRFEEPLANLLNEQHRTVRQQLELLRLKKSVRQQQQQHQIPECEDSKSQNEKSTQILILDPGQKRRLQQQMQQHVQLLTQMHLLSSNNPGLSSEADTARMFLMELATFASNSMLLHRLSNPEFQTTFEPCNLRDSLQLIEDFHAQIPVDWSPHKAEKKNANDLPCLPRHVAWVMATCSLFMYPELLPICCLKAKNPRGKVFFTKAEDNLLALGLKHFEGSEFPKPLMSKYLLTSKTAHQLTVRIKNLNMKRTPENIIKYYKRTKLLPILFKCCDDIQPHEARPPVEREEQRLPFWLKANLTTIQEEMRQRQDAEEDSKTPDGEAEASSGEGVKATVKEDPETAKAGQSGKYPLIMPKGLVLILKPKASRFSRRAWRQKRSSILNPLLMKPTPALQSGLCSTNIHKNVAKPTAPEAPSNRAIQPATVMQALTNTQPLGISAVGNLSAISQPVTFQPKMMLPMLASTRVRKPYIRRGQKKKIATKMPPVLKPTPLTHPAPVIFTVPAGTVKLVSLGGGCSVIQSVNTATNGTTQGMPVTTVLVNTTSFSCPLTRPLVTSPLFVSSNPLTIPVVASQAVVESQSTNVKNLCPATGGEVSQFPIQPKTSGLDPDDSVPVEQYKEEHSLNVLDENRDKISKDDSDVVVKTEEEENQPCTGQGLLCSASEEPVELVRTNTSEGGLEKQDPAQKWLQKQGYLLHNDKEDLVLDLEKESDVVIPQEDLSKQEAEIKTENAKAKDPVEVPSSKERQKQGTDEAEGIKGHSESTKSMSVPTDVEIEVEIELDTDLGSPAGKPEDGPETGRDEEEEEDFDDLTQDEEDEEISSASEESVLSVPELQANLTTIQEEMRQRQDAEEDSKTPDGEAEASSGEGVKASVKEDPETAKAGQSGKYPLIMPKGLVLILKPKASRFSRRAWRQKRSSILNPFLMKPTPALQSGLCSTNIHKNVAKPTAPEAPSNRAIQPATVMQVLTNTQPLGISAVGNLSAISQPVTFQPKMMLPMLASTRVRKPYIRRGQKKKIATKMPPVLKPTPLTHPAPVIFTVPAGTVKLVSLGGGCSVIQSVNTATNRTTQGMPVTIVLVNTTSFSCPLTQPLVTSPLFVSSNPLTIPVVASQAVVESQSVNVKNLCPATGGEVSQFPLQPKTSGLDPDDSVPVEQYKEEHILNVLDENRDKISKNDSNVIVKTEEEEYQPCTGQGLLCSASEEPVELVRTNTSEGGLEKQDPAQKWLQKQGYFLHNDKEDLVLDLEKESDVVIPQEDLSKQEAEIKTENATANDPVEVPSSKERQKQGTDEAEGIKGHSESTKSMSVSTDVEIEVEIEIELDADLGSPAGKPEDGPETGRDEEEDFDDLTQDEEDEEISSASEELVLSVKRPWRS
uniref:GON-4-like protein isoform X2 n=1 Tax=Geotrypetes seraphini TaxID=260995 RepID=A0A6P8NUQ1_GEOSA|nr:GON-4-like protein isoform X2 [Geotrypetes seraphini]